LGLFGLFFWALFLSSTFRDVLVVNSKDKVGEAQPIVVEQGLYPNANTKADTIDKASINRMGHLVLLSLTGFLVAGMFLSRAYVLSLFMLGGIGESVFQMALDRGMVEPRIRLGRALRDSAVLTVVMLIAMYAGVRILNLLR